MKAISKYDMRYQARIRVMRLERTIDRLRDMIDGANIQLDQTAKELDAEREHYKAICKDLDLPEIVPVKMEIE